MKIWFYSQNAHESIAAARSVEFLRTKNETTYSCYKNTKLRNAETNKRMQRE